MNLNRKCQVQNNFFGRRLSNARGCFRTWSNLKKKYRFVHNWLTEKGLTKLCSVLKVCLNS